MSTCPNTVGATADRDRSHVATPEVFGVRTLSTRRRVPAVVGILLEALKLNAPNTDELQRLNDVEWGELLNFCVPASLTFPLAQLPNKGFPLWVIERLEEDVRDNSLRFERTKETYREATQALASAGVEHVVIKGFAQYPGYVTSPRLRGQSDIDLYCPQESIHRAQQALERVGYSPEEDQYCGVSDHMPTLVKKTGWVWRGRPYDPEWPLSIELHFCLWNRNLLKFDIEGVEALWQRRVQRQTEDLSFSSLDEVDNFGYVALHVLRNILTRSWALHLVFELAMFMHSRASDEAFWQRWQDLHHDSLRSREAIALFLAAQWFDCDLPSQVQEEIAKLPQPVLSWLNEFSGSLKEILFFRNRDQVWLHLCLLDTFWQRARFLPRALMPTRIPGSQEPALYLSNGKDWTSWITQRHVKYLVFLLSRVGFHTQLIALTLWRGLKWQLANGKLYLGSA